MTSIVHKRVIKDIEEGKINLKNEFGIYIAPEENDFYKVHFILPGPEDTPFEGGLYHGMIRLNNNHPMGAPNIHMITPNGRFMSEQYPIPNGSRGICTTATSFHPESWTPVSNIETVLKGFISLMCDPYDGGIGGIKSSNEKMKELAKDSINHIKSDIIVKKLFPELYESIINGTYKPIKMAELSNPKKITIQINNEQKINSKTKKTETENNNDSNILDIIDNQKTKKSIKKKKYKFKSKNDSCLIMSDSDDDKPKNKKIIKKEIKNKQQTKRKNNKSYHDSKNDTDEPESDFGSEQDTDESQSDIENNLELSPELKKKSINKSKNKSNNVKYSVKKKKSKVSTKTKSSKQTVSKTKN